jgi:DNA polymerase-4
MRRGNSECAPQCRGTDFTKHTRRTTLDAPTNVSRVIYDTVIGLFNASPIRGKLVRLIGVGLTGFAEAVQTSLFEAKTHNPAFEASEKAVDAVIAKFGKNAIFLGGEKLSGD